MASLNSCKIKDILRGYFMVECRLDLMHSSWGLTPPKWEKTHEWAWKMTEETNHHPKDTLHFFIVWVWPGLIFLWSFLPGKSKRDSLSTLWARVIQNLNDSPSHISSVFHLPQEIQYFPKRGSRSISWRQLFECKYRSLVKHVRAARRPCMHPRSVKYVA